MRSESQLRNDKYIMLPNELGGLKVVNGFKQTCSKKFEFWRRQLNLSKFKKRWFIGEAFCRVDCLDCLVFLFS